MKLKRILWSLALAACIGCGGGSKPIVVHANTGPAFPPAQSLTCTGNPSINGGQICQQSDGVHQYILYQFAITNRQDGHGTFLLSVENGNSNLPIGLQFKQIQVLFPVTVNLEEIHGTLNLLSYCSGNGLATYIDGDGLTNVEHLIAGKTTTLNAGDEPNFVIQQVLFPTPIPLNGLLVNINNDNCAPNGPTSLINWTINGSF